MPAQKFRSPRGMHDVLPDDLALRSHLRSTVQEIVDSYGYRELALPLVESTGLFHRSLGEQTDIISKEMYQLHSKSLKKDKDTLSLRPEGTAGCIRAAIQHGLTRSRAKLWYGGEMFRYERPQKNRFRQFYQIGVEAIGYGGVETEIDLLCMGFALWRAIGLEDQVHLHINSLGSDIARRRYCDALLTHLKPHVATLGEDDQRRLHRNPLRILDSKDQLIQGLLKDGPQLQDYWETADKERFKTLCTLLEDLALPFEVNAGLVRGLDYYTGLVFEWQTTEQASQSALAAGGRYDGLVETLGGSATTAAGFAIGVERVMTMLKNIALPIDDYVADAYMVCESEQHLSACVNTAMLLRENIKGLRLLGPDLSSLKSQLRRAEKTNVPLVVLYPATNLDQAIAADQGYIYYLRDNRSNAPLPITDIESLLVEQVKMRIKAC